MSRPRPPHLQRHKTRHGSFVWYYQIGHGPLVRIRAEFGTREFDEEYRSVAAAYSPFRAIRATIGTLGLAWLLYKQSGAWKGLTKATQRQRENIMKHVLEESSHVALTEVTPEVIHEGIERRMDTPFQAKNWLQTMNQLFEFLVKDRKLKLNPAAGQSVKKPKTKGFLEWSEDDILKYETRWPRGTRERVMLDVYMYTGLRRGDAARVGKQHVSNGVIKISTEKSQGQTTVHLPILQPLKQTLDAGPVGDLAFIVTPTGKPYVKESLGAAFKAACLAAGIPDKSAHGLRKAAATRAADNGATAHELMAIFGWIDIKEAEIYTRAADRKRLAKGAMSKLEQ